METKTGYIHSETTTVNGTIEMKNVGAQRTSEITSANDYRKTLPDSFQNVGGDRFTKGTTLGGRDLSNYTEKDKRSLRLKILKNVLVLTFGFLLLFTAFQSLSNLQSTVNSDEGLGTASLSVIYAALVISCLFVPTYMISLIGLKFTVFVSMLLYSTYFFGNFYASWYTLIPTSAILGLGGAPLWTAKCAYLTELAKNYALIVGQKKEAIVSRFFGVFFAVFQTGQIWGNLISSYILQPKNSTELDLIDADSLKFCGANFCKEPENNTNLERPPDKQIYLLVGIYSACSVLAALMILLFLDQLRKPSEHTDNANDERQATGTKRPSFGLLIETFRHLKNPYQILLVPLTIYSGLEQAYITGDFTKAFVGCSWGIHNVGFAMICFGALNAICSFGYGPLIKITGRVTIFIFGASLNIAMIITMFKWSPNPEEKVVLFIIAGLWGMADAVWQTQINTLYGVLFSSKNQEAAFANYRLWESLGFIVAFAYSSHLCISYKLWILLVVLVLGMTGYLTIEVHMKFTKGKHTYTVKT